MPCAAPQSRRSSRRAFAGIEPSRSDVHTRHVREVSRSTGSSPSVPLAAPIRTALLAGLVLCALPGRVALARPAPTLWTCEAEQGAASGASLGKRGLLVGVSPEGACWLDWNPLSAAGCMTSRAGRDLVIDLPGRGQMSGARWIIELGAGDVRAAGCKVGDRVGDADPKSYLSKGCLCRRATLAEAGMAWRRSRNLDVAVALMTPFVDALVREGPAEAAADELAAAHELAVILDQRGAAGDLEVAQRYAVFAAMRGHAEAAYLVGRGFELGRGVTADLAAAARWYRRSAEGGSRRAMTALGLASERGAGVPADLAEALRWYRAAADAGSTSGMLGLGRLFRDGKGVTQDAAMAYRWLFGASLSEDAETRSAAVQERDAVGHGLTPQARAAAEAQFRAWNKARRAGATPAVPPR